MHTIFSIMLYVHQKCTNHDLFLYFWPAMCLPESEYVCLVWINTMCFMLCALCLCEKKCNITISKFLFDELRSFHPRFDVSFGRSTTNSVAKLICNIESNTRVGWKSLEKMYILVNGIFYVWGNWAFTTFFGAGD